MDRVLTSLPTHLLCDLHFWDAHLFSALKRNVFVTLLTIFITLLNWALFNSIRSWCRRSIIAGTISFSHLSSKFLFYSLLSSDGSITPSLVLVTYYLVFGRRCSVQSWDRCRGRFHRLVRKKSFSPCYHEWQSHLLLWWLERFPVCFCCTYSIERSRHLICPTPCCPAENPRGNK